MGIEVIKNNKKWRFDCQKLPMAASVPEIGQLRCVQGQDTTSKEGGKHEDYPIIVKDSVVDRDPSALTLTKARMPLTLNPVSTRNQR